MVNRMPNDDVLISMIFSINLDWYYCFHTIQACIVTLITPRNQWFQCAHTSGKEISRAEKNRGPNDLSAGKEKLKNHAAVYTIKYYQISATEETFLHVVRLTQPFQRRSLEGGLISAVLESWGFSSSNGHLQATQHCWKLNLAVWCPLTDRRVYQWDYWFPHHFS